MRIYLYLTKRNKQDLKLVMILQGLKTLPTRLEDVETLRLPPVISQEVAEIIRQNRMEWEPWIESAENYAELKLKLEQRGYRNLPVRADPIHKESSYNDPHVADTRKLIKKTMVRKPT